MSYKKSSILLMSLILPFILIKDANAYLDPATGSMILQIILGFILAASMTIKVYWRKIKDFFSKNKSQTETESDPTQEPAMKEESSSGTEQVKFQG